MKTVTIKTIAEYAGVSRGTVDRVLNSRPHVSPDQQTRVLRAIRDLKCVNGQLILRFLHSDRGPPKNYF